MSRLIPLTQGKFATVDDEDFEELNKYKWHFSCGYAYRTERHNGNKRTIAMHREIAHIPDGLLTDHANQRKLDNRRSNLRSCTQSLNHANIKKRGGLTSLYKGVCFSKRDKKWTSRVKKDGSIYSLGNHSLEVEAAKAYDKKAIELYGKFAYLNFKRKGYNGIY